jgi:hypothetical protein
MSSAKVRAAVVATVVAVLAVPVIATASAPGRSMRIVFMIKAEPYRDVANLECAVGFRAEAVFRFGFAAALSDAQAARIQHAAGVYDDVRLDPASFVVRLSTLDRASVEARTRELELRFGFRSDHVYAGTFGGFATVLGWRQLALMSDERDLDFTPDPYTYIVIFESGVDVDPRIDELERRYGFRAQHRYRGISPGFAAELGKDQLAGLTSEGGIRQIVRDRFLGFWPTPAPDCLRPGPATKRAIHAAFLRAHGKVRRVRLVAVRLGAWKGREYALATFRGRAVRPGSQPERFEREPPGRWRDLGPTNGRACSDQIPHEVLRVWVLPWVDRCFRLG